MTGAEGFALLALSAGLSSRWRVERGVWGVCAAVGVGVFVGMALSVRDVVFSVAGGNGWPSPVWGTLIQWAGMAYALHIAGVGGVCNWLWFGGEAGHPPPPTEPTPVPAPLLPREPELSARARAGREEALSDGR